MKLKNIITGIFAISVFCRVAQADTTTSRLGLTKPSIGSTGWGVKWNTNADAMDLGTAVLASSNVFTSTNIFSNYTEFAAGGTVVFSTSPSFAIQAFGSNGSVSAPSFSFANDKTMGMYRVGSNQLGFATNGVRSFFIGSDGFINMDTGHSIALTDGTTTYPGLNFGSDNNTGIMRQAADNFQAIAGGVTQASFTTTGAFLKGQTSNTTAPAGWQGEYKSSAAAAYTSFPASGAWGDLASVLLEPGAWMVTMNLTATANGATVTSCQYGISTSSGLTSGLTSGITQSANTGPTAAFDNSAVIPPLQVNLSANTTYYLKYNGAYSVATPQARGVIKAWRPF